MSEVTAVVQAHTTDGRPQLAALMLLVLVLFTTASHVHADAANTAAPHTPVNDVRVLIDISGSMKTNDPANLRQPALNLFVSLLPNETQAGVWTFGQWVNMLIPHGPVTAAWKNDAKASVQKINSAGLFTNIEDAIRRSTWDWRDTPPTSGSERNLILLTDGLVDIALDEQENRASRQRILRELLPLLQKAGVTIHAIALSNESDRNLLEQLTTATGGRFEVIETAENLERLFLRLFDNVAQADSLPLTDNRVKVDDSIKEMTFLVFRGAAVEESSITSPAGEKYDINNKPQDVTWHKESNYDLVTVKNPAAGYWQINTKEDPDNRVMIVTDLKLVNTRLPVTLSVGDKQTLHLHLENSGTMIDQRDFLHFVKATLNQVAIDTENEEKKWNLKILDNGKGVDKKEKDGIYSIELNETLIAGEHDIEVEINGTTFRRQFRKQLTVYAYPATANIEPVSKEAFRVSVLPYQTLIDTDAMQVTAEHKLPNGEINKITITRVNPAEWMQEFTTNGIPGKHEVTIAISGSSKDGKPLEATLPPLSIDIDGEKSPPPESNKPETEEQVEGIDNSVTNTETEEEPVSWVMVSVKVGLFNIIVIGIFFAAYKYSSSIRKKPLKKQSEEESDG
ncbi:MAG: VWA domain-containing protein [Gammaproteobacteria bacterium]|nr:VWA domain-containing protein [Gammaproteobacteria bacterium]